MHDHPYAELLPRVKKPSRYLGGEQGEIRKNWDTVEARICLAFPDLYEVGMSHLGFKILYSLINAQPDLLAERAYAPWIDMEAELRARGEPLRSLETWQPLSAFDVVGFSLQFELTYTNVLQMLELGGIPLRSAARGERDPLVIAGGPCATHPEPLSAFLDAILIGDGEERAPEILRVWVQAKREGLSRAARLERLAGLSGVYVPSLYETELDPDTGMRYVARPKCEAAPLPVKRAFVPDISRYPFPKDGPIASTETVFDRVSVEIARGCTEGCRFCQAGMIYRPVRERAPEEVIDVVRGAVQKGYEAASLTSLSTADYSAISPLIHAVSAELAPARTQLGVSSLRAYGLDEDVLDALSATGASGLTFAPEAGTQRMRDVVNKNVTEAQLLETARRVFSRGWSKMKLYFMIGLPTEEDADVLGIIETGARARAVGRELAGNAAQVTCGVSTHVPKPHTPFQWCAMDGREQVLRKQALLKQAAKRAGVMLRMHDSAGSLIEGVIARGDRSVCDAIEGAYKRGARFDSWEERLDLDAWHAAFAEAGVDPQRFLGTIPTSAKLPWDHIDVGLEPGFLAREYRKALRNRLSPPCGKAVGSFVHHTNLEAHAADRRKLVCYDCGVACDMDAMRENRGQFLVRLGALTKRVKPEHAPELDSVPRPSKPAGKRRPPPRADQGTPLRVRLGYEKLGRAAFASHLDLVRLLPRLFRRLSLPLYYSLGFHPKPVMVFGPALPLGTLSLCEYVDVKLAVDAIDAESLPERLSASAIDGVRFVGARVLSAEDAKLSRVVDHARYVAALPRAALAQLGVRSEAELAARIAAGQNRELVVRRDYDGIGKRIDVRAYLIACEVGRGADALARAGLAGELTPIEIVLRITPNGTAKPSEALEALLGHADLPLRFVRAALTHGATEAAIAPLELERLRSALGAETERPSAAEAPVPAEKATLPLHSA